MGLIKDSSELRLEIHNRLKQLYPRSIGHLFDNAKVVKDANSRGFKIQPEALSRYISGSKKASLSENQIIWLAFRYGIPLQLGIGKPILKDNKIIFEVQEYNESESLNLLNKIFNNG